MAWTYYVPELTLKEMELAENKNEEYMRSFKLSNNADVNETEMKESSSSSKYISAYCRRKTIRIERQKFLDRNQYSSYKENPTPTVEVNATKMSITEGEAVPGQKKRARRINVSQKLILLCMILVPIIGGIVGLSIYFTKTRTSPSSSTVLSTTTTMAYYDYGATITAAPITKKDPAVKDAVLILSTNLLSNDPMVITSTG